MKNIFLEQLESQRQQSKSLKHRYDGEEILSLQDQARFYSSWHFGAVHVCVSLLDCKSVQAISEYLGISESKTREVLLFLKQIGMVIDDPKHPGGFEVGKTHIHLGDKSELINQHHTNWRMKAIESLDHRQENDLHYSSVITCSQADSQKAREILAEAIGNIRKIVKQSENEAGYCYLVDLFPLRRWK